MTTPSPQEIQELRLLMGSAKDPEGRVFAQLGDALRRAGELHEARMILEEGVEQHPHFTPGHVALAWVAMEEGDLSGAQAAFSRSVELDPENPFGLFGLGSLLHADGDDSGSDLLAHARSLHETVDEFVPAVALERVSLAELPFLSLEDLAPDESELDRLPFVSLADLAPEEAIHEEPADVAPLEEAAVPPAPEMVEEDDGSEAEEDATPVTRTMAELMAQQGHGDRALELYDQLIEENPGDSELEARAQELRDSLESVAEAAAPPVEPADEEDHPALNVPEPAEAAPTPFGWAEVEDGESDVDEGTPGPSAGSYFGGLLGWKPGEDDTEGSGAS